MAANRLYLDEMTSAEIIAAVAGGARTAIVPLGAIEAHGPHLPVNTDALLARHVATLVAQRLDGALVAPVIPFGYLPRTRFAGSISVSVDVVLGILHGYCQALRRDGFKIIALLPLHGEHFQTVLLYAPELGSAYPELTIVAGLDMEQFFTLRNEIAVGYGIDPFEAGWHAGAAETSEVLAYDARLVRTDALRLGYLGPSGFSAPKPETLRDGWVALDREGVMGDPRKALAEFGQDVLDAFANYFASHIRSVDPSSAGKHGDGAR